MPTIAELLHETRKIAAIYREQYTSDHDPRGGYTKLLAANEKRNVASYGEDTAYRMERIARSIVMRYSRQPDADELVYDGQ